MNRNQEKIDYPKTKIYFPYESGAFRVAMDLHILDLAEWIEVDEQMPAELAEKRRLLAGRHQEVFAALPEAEQGSRETLELLVNHLSTHFFQIYQKDGERFYNKATGEVWNLAESALHPLELAGRLVQEDLCLMGRDPETNLYRLTGACLCFPTRWNLLEKVGQSLAGIHVPVPRYDTQIESPMNRLFARLKANRPVWRLNWSLLDDPTLFQSAGHGETDCLTHVTAKNADDNLWIRTERQTLRRLPESQDILFTIKIYVQPLSWLANKPARARQLVTALQDVDKEMQTYKSLSPISEAAILWLESAIKKG